MRKLIRLRTVLIAMILTCMASLACSHPKPQVESLTRHDSLIFKGKVDSLHGLDTIVQKVGLQPLRNHFVADGDLEIRIWRYGFEPLEAVLIRRTRGKWSGDHVITDDYVMPKNVELSVLKTPSSGWENLWASLKENGLLEISDADDDSCSGTIDGTGYVVEINEKGKYRNYMVPEGLDRCGPSPQMTRIGEIVGIEFDDGKQKCTAAEWFPCKTYLKNKER